MNFPSQPPDQPSQRLAWLNRIRAPLRDGVEFARDLFWLLGWGARRTFDSANRTESSSDEGGRWRGRGCLGCFLSILLVALAGGVWRRTRSRHRLD